MKSPFIYGQIAEGETFINRTKEISRFKNAINSGIHQIMVSPRRWGKSSLMRRIAQEFKSDSKFRFCFVDLFRVRSEQEFISLYAKTILKATSDKIDEIMQIVKNNLTKLIPRLSFSPEASQEFELSIEFPEKPTDIHEIIELAEKIAVSKKIKLVVCIDEFQNIANFTDSLSFQKLLRSYWQYHKNVIYCLYGSKRHMMAELFEKQSMPFYRFGDTNYLLKIEKEELIAFIIKRFKATGKNINEAIAEKLVDTMECHPYYVQEMAHILWINTPGKATEQLWDKAVEELFIVNHILYQREYDSLSNKQINLLKALISGNEINLTSKDTIINYKLGTSATVLRCLDGLEKKEIIDKFVSKIEFIDPGFKLWLKTKIFKYR